MDWPRGMFGAVPFAAADPVVYQNTSYIFGYAAVLQGGTPIETGNSFDTSGTLQPTSGAWGLADTRTMNGLEAGAIVTSSAGGTVSPRRLTGTGTVLGLAFAPAGTNVTAQAWGRAVLNLSFELDQAYTFRYSGGYFADSDGTFGALAARLSPLQSRFGDELPPVFTDRFQFFSGALAERRTHVGFLNAGSYRLVLANDPLSVLAPGDTFRNSTMNFSFDLTPVPEPTSVLLLAAGLAGLAGRRWRSRSR